MNPLIIVGNLHYQTINDLTWLEDAMLAVASSDGFCSFILFEGGLKKRIVERETNYYAQAGIEEKQLRVE